MSKTTDLIKGVIKENENNFKTLVHLKTILADVVLMEKKLNEKVDSEQPSKKEKKENKTKEVIEVQD